MQTSPSATIVDKRVRLERRYGEEITNGNLLQEMKEKQAAKGAQAKRRRGPQKKSVIFQLCHKRE